MISFHEAQQLIISKARNFGTETIPLEHADNRILAEAIFADRDYPPFNRSAVDGFAINLDDWNRRIREYKVAAQVFAGELVNAPLQAGECYKIMTGASVPDSANLVIRREDARENTNKVQFIIDKVNLGQNVARKGEDLKKGEPAIHANTLCSAVIISTLATLGKNHISVHKLPRVALFTTGNEVKAINAKLSPVEIRNSNQWLLRSLLKSWNIKPYITEHINDKPADLKAVISRALDLEVLIMCGGVSAGDADFVPDVLQNLEVKKLFHKVEIKPGKPTWCGELSTGGLVFALPGNPFSCLVNFKIFIEPYLRTCFGLKAVNTKAAIFASTRPKKTNFDEFFPAVIDPNTGELAPSPTNGSGDIRLGLNAEALVHHKKTNPELTPGTFVQYYPLFS